MKKNKASIGANSGGKKAGAGHKLKTGGMAAKASKPTRGLELTEKGVWEALKSVMDPELQLNVVDMGLIYKVQVDKRKGEVYVQMTMTTPACPLASMIEESARSHVSQIPGAKNVIIEVVFEPLWNIDKMNPDARASLGL